MAMSTSGSRIDKGCSLRRPDRGIRALSLQVGLGRGVVHSTIQEFQPDFQLYLWRVHDMFYMMMSDNASASTGVSRLFLAVVPDAATAARMYRLAGILKRAYQFSGKPIEPDRLHVSLVFLGGLPDHAIATVCEAVAETRMQPFEVSFDRSVSFLGSAGSRPFVLMGDEGASGLMSLRQKLGATLTRAGLRRRANAPFTPHATLLYDSRRVDEHPIDPISWTVSEFVLIRSKNGHTHLARWPLRA